MSQSSAAVEIIPFSEDLAPHFTRLNTTWLEKYFTVEPIDREMLSKPGEYFIAKGGLIFFARINGVIAGTFALLKETADVYELSKMAVDENYQGLKIGNRMLEFCKEKARELHLSKIILYSSTRLTPAIHLYRKYGFKEVPIGNSIYKRSDIKMELEMSEHTNRIDQVFKRKEKGVLNVYFTAGYPYLESLQEVLQSLQDNGADIVEIGMPYSDPLADGPIIQQSNMIALHNGMSLHELFKQLEKVRETIHVPIILMGYMNPVLQFGLEKFCAAAEKAGVDGLILPDLPMYEFETEYRALFEKHGLRFIFLVTPETSEERIRKIDSLSSGFLYAVSSSSTTGNNKPIADQSPYFKKLQDMKLNNPILVGFGIKDKATFDSACRYANGAIIGSAYIRALENSDNITLSTKEFLNRVLA